MENPTTQTEGAVTLFADTDKTPFDVNLFSPYFKFTYYCTAYVLGMEASPLMDIFAMAICANIQSKGPRTFDYAYYLACAINHGLAKLKGDRVNVNFRYYSHLMHMLLYIGQDIGLWTQGLSIWEYDRAGIHKPVQLWLSARDQRYINSQYMHFEEYFVKPLYKLLGHPCDFSLSP